MAVEDNEESGQVMAGTSIASVLRDRENLYQSRQQAIRLRNEPFNSPNTDKEC